MDVQKKEIIKKMFKKHIWSRLHYTVFSRTRIHFIRNNKYISG